jgi:hypothetical protein
MDLLQVAALGVVFSALVSAGAAVILLGPTKGILQSICPTGQGVTFWTLFTSLMIVLGPLLVTLIFGVPSSAEAERLKVSDLVIRALTSALVGGFVTVGGIGIRIATLRPQLPPPVPARHKTDDEYLR